MLARVYWRLAREAGWTYPEIDELPLQDFDEIAEQWGGGEVDTEEDAQVVTQKPKSNIVSEEEFQRICARERAFAEKHGGPRNPFL